MHNDKPRSNPHFTVGCHVTSPWHGESGTVVEIDWSVSFGAWSYRIVRDRPGRYRGNVGESIWICQSDLRTTKPGKGE